MLKATFHGNYKKRTMIKGQDTVITVFRYTVSGSAEDIKQYEEAQGDNLVIDDKTGKPLYFTTNYISDNVELTITENGKVVVDDSEFAKLKSLIDTYGEGVARLMLMKQSS